MKRQLWYRTWTEEFKEGLPVGNGRIAAMMLGEPSKLRIALNHEWMWRGDNRFREYPDVSDHLPEIRKALLDGDFLRGTTLANKYLAGLGGISGVAGRVDPFQPVGDLWVNAEVGEVSDYYRSLDLNTGVATTTFVSPTAGAVTERLFISSADGCGVFTMTSEKPMDIDVSLSRVADPRCLLTHTAQENGIVMKGVFLGGISFETDVRAVSNGKVCTYVDDTAHFSAKGATTLTLLLQIGTDAKNNAPTCEMTWPETFEFDVLLARHTPCFSALLGGAAVEIDLPDNDDLPTDERIRLFREGGDPALPLLYFEYGRYLMVSGSTAELPLNLQGKWNEDILPPWESDYHLDINLEMAYWFVETLGMKKAADPLFNLIERFIPYGRVRAKNLYGCGGFTFTLQTDVWGRVTPEAYGWAVWTGAAPWLGQHMFMHWRYTKDEAFLRDRCYPYLKECAAFYEDYLIERDGQLCIVPSQSPENLFVGTGDWPVSISYNCAMDIELITELLNHAIESATLLGVDADKVEKWKDILSRLPALGVDDHGRLVEWDSKDRIEIEPEHRHLSHLYGLYPAQLFEPGSREWIAAERSLDMRMSAGGGHTGWSRSWVACLMARLGRAEDAMEHFRALIGDFATVSLLDLHPPRVFQIDGNMGGTACVCEMLMQSRKGELWLLPALPAEWQSGRVSGFCGQDTLVASFAWENGALTACTLSSKEPQTLKVVCGDMVRTVELLADVPYTLSL